MALAKMDKTLSFFVGLGWFEMEEIPTNVIFKTQELKYTLPPIIMVQ